MSRSLLSRAPFAAGAQAAEGDRRADRRARRPVAPGSGSTCEGRTALRRTRVRRAQMDLGSSPRINGNGSKIQSSARRRLCRAPIRIDRRARPVHRWSSALDRRSSAAPATSRPATKGRWSRRARRVPRRPVAPTRVTTRQTHTPLTRRPHLRVAQAITGTRMPTGCFGDWAVGVEVPRVADTHVRRRHEKRCGSLTLSKRRRYHRDLPAHPEQACSLDGIGCPPFAEGSASSIPRVLCRLSVH
jgi:hypothetical protein